MKEAKKFSLLKLILLTFSIICIAVSIKIVNSSYTQNIDLRNQDNKRIRQWKKDLERYSLSSNSIKLHDKFSFPNNKLEQDGIYLFGADHMCLDYEGNIYISDSRDNCIFKFDSQGKFLKKIGRKGQGPNEFNNVLYLDTDKENNLLAYDDNNSRIQILDSKGDYIKSFKTFNTGYEMLSDKQGHIYMGFKHLNSKDSLIGVFDYKGKLIRSFGKPLTLYSHSYASLPILISLNEKNGEIFLTWSWFPIVRRYSKAGKLLSEYEIRHKIMQEYGKKNQDVLLNKSVSPPRLFIVIKGIRAKKNGFYLFRYYPRIEILEINLDGELVKTYWSDQTYDFIASDFLIKENDKEKLIYILQRYPENKVNVYYVKK